MRELEFKCYSPRCQFLKFVSNKLLCLSVCLCVCLSVSREDGYAARTREEKKMNKYAGQFLPCGSSSKCVPLIFEHFGRWGLHTFLCHLSKYCSRTDTEPFSNDKQFKTFWRKRFSTTLQICNARVVLKKLSRLSDTKIDTDKLFDFDIQGQVH